MAHEFGCIGTSAPGSDIRRLRVSVERTGGLARGAVVDVYRVPEPKPGKKPGSARLVLAAITVADVLDEGRALGVARRREVVLLLPSAAVPELLDATGGARLELVEVPVAGAAR